MSQYQQPALEGKDPELWEIAQKRAGFKRHGMVYIIVNGFLQPSWLFTGNAVYSNWNEYPWTIWTTLGWGIGLVFHFAGVYVFPTINLTQREYQKIKNKSIHHSSNLKK